MSRAGKLLRPGLGRLALTIVAWAAFGFSCGLAFVAGGSALIGLRSYTVMSGSMEPALHVGAVIVDERIRPADARTGDIVTFTSPTDPGILITHRVRRVLVQGSNVAFVTKGDANGSAERWKVPASGSIGRVRAQVPYLGYALAWTRGRTGRMALVVLPALLLGALWLRQIWRPRPEGSPDAEPAMAGEARAR
jgi:signal peptidase